MEQASLLLERNAVISDCGRYRYVLTRQVGPGMRSVTFIMLNPSTADATTDDHTIRKCIGFARRWGCGKLTVLNLFAFRATKPPVMKKAADPVGPENKAWFDQHLAEASESLVVCAWGVHGAHQDQDLAVLGWLERLGIQPQALAITKDGHPQHPLMLGYDSELVPFVGRSS
ncbi:MAG: hypothetical protein JWO38_3322 [Gemmataceae bacterium]|nr:hypothetical protein [Gemmataceae bacterium]